MPSRPAVRYEVLATGVNLRESGALTAPVIRLLPKGERVLYVGKSADGNWLKVRHRQRVGWVAAKYVQAVELPTSGPGIPDNSSDSRPEIAGFVADSASGTDRLGIHRDVDALASIMVARAVTPPLSIGLFGEWGSGKSFFMDHLWRQIEQHREHARSAPETSPFCRDVIQIRFNAWHYMDTSLWASLSSHIFEELGRVVEEDSSPSSAGGGSGARARLLTAIGGSRDLVAEAERHRDDAEAMLKVTQQEAERLREAKGRDPILLALEASDQPVLKEHLQAAAKRLGLSEAKAATDELQAQLLRAAGFGGKIRAIASALTDHRTATPYLAVLGALALVQFAATDSGFVGNLPELIRTGTSVVAAIGGALLWFNQRVTPAFQILESVETARQNVVKKAQEKAGEDRTVGEDRVKEADAAVAAARAHLSELQRQFASLAADRQIADFVRGRRASLDYTQHLGVVARARRDFERLRDLLKARATETPAPDAAIAPTAQIPRIDRIVLYIDDLDRCPEPKVVDVLQAVHLLLGIDMFVVVVGVDPRWLLHSLEEHSNAFRTETVEGVRVQKEEWRSTAMDYLEKIFQIPFTLQPMGKGGFEDLIGSLVTAPPPSSQSTDAKLDADGDPSIVPVPTASPGVGDATPGGVPLQGQPVGDGAASDPADIATKPVPDARDSAEVEDANTGRPDAPAYELLRLTPNEEQFVKRLHRFIPSPRAAKRFINVYRLLRASLEPSARQRLVGEHGAPEYEAVLLLLAIQIGFAEAAVAVLKGLMSGPTGEFVDLIRKVEKAGARGESAAQCAALRAAIESDEVPRDLSLNTLARWAPRVARYSFQSGRILLDRDS